MLRFIGTEQDLLKYHWEYGEIYDNFILEKVWFYTIGYSSRGQFYYYLINMEDEYRTLSIYASEPDGMGAFVSFNDVIIYMFNEGLFEITKEGDI